MESEGRYTPEEAEQEAAWMQQRRDKVEEKVWKPKYEELSQEVDKEKQKRAKEQVWFGDPSLPQEVKEVRDIIPELFFDSGEGKEARRRKWDSVKTFIDSIQDADKRDIALGLLARAPLTGQIIEDKPQETPLRELENYREQFPGLIQDDLIDYAKKLGKYDQVPRFSADAVLDENYCRLRLLELATGLRVLPQSEDFVDINQWDLSMYFHGMRISDLRSVLESGVKSHRELGKVQGVPAIESAFPMCVSFSRPTQKGYYGETAYMDSYVVKANYGASGMNSARGLTTVIPKFGYIFPHSMSAREIDYRGYQTTPDEWESTGSSIPPGEIYGLICNYDLSDEINLGVEQEQWKKDERDEIIRMIQESGRDVKLYGPDGSLLWPEAVIADYKEDGSAEEEEEFKREIKETHAVDLNKTVKGEFEKRVLSVLMYK